MPKQPDPTMLKGMIHTTKKGESFKILEYVSNQEIYIQFIGSSKPLAYPVRAGHIRNKSIANPHALTICGVACLGYHIHPTKIKGKQQSIYTRYTSMIKRCYVVTHPSYKGYGSEGIRVCDEWLTYGNYEAWYLNQCEVMGIDPFDNDYEVDKDIINRSAKLYSPSNCTLVTAQINSEESHAKSYWFINPNGNRIKVYNLSKFCKDNGLDISCMFMVQSGRRVHHKQWTKG